MLIADKVDITNLAPKRILPFSSRLSSPGLSKFGPDQDLDVGR